MICPGPDDHFERTPVRHVQRLIDCPDKAERSDYVRQIGALHGDRLAADVVRMYREQKQLIHYRQQRQQADR